MHFRNDIANNNVNRKFYVSCELSTTDIIFYSNERTLFKIHHPISFEHSVGYVGLYRLCVLNVRSLMDGDYSKDIVHVYTADLSND